MTCWSAVHGLASLWLDGPLARTYRIFAPASDKLPGILSSTLAALGYPLLLSASNKTFLGKILDLELTERREASIGAAALGIAWGCRIVRVHDVKGTCRARDVLAAVSEAQ